MECNNLLEGYFNYLMKDLLEMKENGYCKVELPFPRPAGDAIILRIEKLSNEEYLLSDQGLIDAYLFTYSIDLWDLSGKSMKEMLYQTKKRYDLIMNDAPNVQIKTTKEKLFESIFQMSNVMNELASMRLLSRGPSIDVFKNQVITYFKENRIKHKKDPTIKINIRGTEYKFKLDFKFRKKRAYTKIINRDEAINKCGFNFDQIRRYHQARNEEIELWALYNDQDSINEKKIKDFLIGYADEVIAWSTDKDQFKKFR